MMAARGAWVMASCLVATSVFVACGARTGLDETISGGGSDAGRRPEDAGQDVGHDVATVVDCADGGSSYIWVLTEDGELFRFHPELDGGFEVLGTLACMDSIPNSMAVDRQGTAYIAFSSGRLYRAMTETTGGPFFVSTPIKCPKTSFKVDQLGFKTFGMGFATDESGPSETLYVAQAAPNRNKPSKGLAKIDTDTYELEFIAPFSQDLGNAIELTGTGDGRLFGLFLAGADAGAHIAEIDKTNGEVLGDTSLAVGTSTSSFAFAFWGGDFYIFTQDGFAPTVVTHYVPSLGTASQVATLPNETVVGAGVSTCAPLTEDPLDEVEGRVGASTPAPD